MLKLYDYGPSANCFKVRLLLAQLEVPYERVPVDIFAGETQSAEYLARNPAGRTPVLELESGTCIPESNAICLYLAEGSELVPADRVLRARVHGWLFFEQNLVEPNIGTAQFWRMTGRWEARPEAFAQRVEAGRATLAVLERHLAERVFLVDERYTVADLCTYAYAHKAPGAGIDLDETPSVQAWLRRIEGAPGFMNDVDPYPPNAMAGEGESVHG
jgi:glutathione S-transferase